MVQGVGHVVLKVRDLERAEAFYRDVLGLRVVAHDPEARMVFFIADGSGRHHDLAILEVGPGAPAPPRGAVGLAHVAFKVGDDLDALRRARDRLRERGVAIDGEVDHVVSQSLYFRDPDGNHLECYVDADPAIWRARPEVVTTSRPLAW